ncbi:MAG TPA: hypothetical protein VFM23_02630, partial [Gemmatimonadales bacterium]|nr:hypothetical protein [Gemmatimonadales bacterium]
VRFDYLNAQDQQKLVWPASFVVARAYLDQLARSGGMPIARINATRDALSRAERASGQARIDALSQVSSQLNSDLATSSDQPKLRLLIAVVGDLAK